MSIKIDGSKAKVHWLSNNHKDGRLTKDQAVLYIPQKPNKLGQVTRDSAAGLKPYEAFEQRYNDKSLANSNVIADDIFVIEKSQGENFDYDDGFREFVHVLYKKKQISFDALYPGYQLPNTNTEALLYYNREEHRDVLVNCLKQYCGLGTFFDTKCPVIWRYKQEEDIEKILKTLNEYKLCLYAAYTSRGKTKISIEVATRLYQKGGIVLVTTPITDTKKSFRENINDFHFGIDRNLQVTYMDSIEFAKYSVADLRKRADAGELIFVVLTVQDLRYGEDTFTKVDEEIKKLRAKYHALSGKVNLWIRDERHAQYGGEITSQRLSDITADYELDLTATPYCVLDKYIWKQVVSRTLLWGLKYKKYTKLPTIRIDAVSTPLSNVDPKISAIYTEKEGFDPRKLFVRQNGNFVLEAELLAIRDLMYHSKLSKKKNPLSITNDTELSSVAKKCGLWVLPEGQDGDGAPDYIPVLAKLMNTNSDAYFIDSYTLEKECPSEMTIGDYVNSLIEKHNRVVILTCGKFLTGTDIPALGHIVLMAKINDIAKFEQLLGRMVREYRDKKEVKMYCFAPAMEIGLTVGKMAKMNAVALDGGDEYEMLDCIPLTEYTADGPKKITAKIILEEAQEFLKNSSKDRLPSASLENRLRSTDLSAWEGVNTKKFKKSAPAKTTVTEENGSKVKTKLSNNLKTAKPYTKDNTITQIANVIQAIMVETKWVAHSINDYDYSKVLNNPALKRMFPSEIDAVISTIENDLEIKDMVIKNFNDKRLAHYGLKPTEVYDDIFMNNCYKQSIGLVYVNFAMAKKLVDKLPTTKYNKEGKTILVVNALSGTFPILLKEKFPKARILCAEYFEYFKDHLKRLGFEVADIYEENGELKLDTKQIPDIVEGMEFDVIVGNPPYQKQVGPNKTEPIWDKFVQFELLKKDGYLALIHPSGWRNVDGRFKDTNRLLLSKQMEYLEIHNVKDGIETFGASTRYDWYILQNKEYQKKTTVVFEDGTKKVINLNKLPFIPNHSPDIIKKLLAKPGEETVEILHSMSAYETRKNHVNDTKTAIFKYPLISRVRVGLDFDEYWSSVNDKGHFNIPKLVFSLDGVTGVYLDRVGKYGLTQFAWAIVDTPENLTQIKKVFDAPSFQELMKATTLKGNMFNHKVISLFRKDFWKEFI